MTHCCARTGRCGTLVDLALAPEHRRGHGALYDALNQGRIDVARLRHALAGMPLPRAADGRLVLAVDVSPWLRPDANTCPDRAFCHTFGRARASTRWCPAGRTRSWPRWRAAARPGRQCWTQSAWSPGRTSPL
ncbi:transposase [Streptomyces netropsis]